MSETIKITIDRGYIKFYSETDCEEKKPDGTYVINSEDVGMALAEAISAVFGGEGDLFGPFDVLVETMYYFKPAWGYYINAGSLMDFITILQKANATWEDESSFLEHFMKIAKQNEVTQCQKATKK